jgi:hypothetical protein
MWSENFLPTATALRIGNASRCQSDHLTAQRRLTSLQITYHEQEGKEGSYGQVQRGVSFTKI